MKEDIKLQFIEYALNWSWRFLTRKCFREMLIAMKILTVSVSLRELGISSFPGDRFGIKV